MPEQVVTFCRICEAHCGMVATVDDGRVTQLRPDPDHPLSRGYACPKGIAMTEVQNDPDRVLHPLKRRPDGSFERVSWAAAMADIGTRLRALRDERGPDSIGWYMGNPGAFSYSHTLWVKGFLDALGSRHYYTAGSQDVNNRFAASALLYGSPLIVPIPDLQRTRFLFMIGANPMVSHGSVLTAPRVRDQLHDITRRGGRVVVVDPRRTETARQFEHVAITPDTDAWLLLAMLHVIFEEGLRRRRASWPSGPRAPSACARSPPRTRRSRSPPAPASTPTTIAGLARDFAAADGAAAYGRTGSCLGRFGTLVAFLIDALNAVTGNLDSPGGAVFGRPAIALDDIGHRFGLDTYGKLRSRFGGFPDVLGNLPASLMPREIETPGDSQLRALFVSAGNPVLSVPDGDALERALGKLDLMVALDFYVNETSRHADYVLPATTFLERDDVPVAFLGFYTKPFIQSTEPVVPPAGEAREEWEVVDELARALDIEPYSVPPLRLLARARVRLSPRRLVDTLLRLGPEGDLFGLRRGGLSLGKLREAPARHRARRRDPDRRAARARSATRTAACTWRPRRSPASSGGWSPRTAPTRRFPMRLIGLRELRSHNSWMHNSPLLMRGGRVHALRVHPDDAAAHGLEDGGDVRVESKSGAVDRRGQGDRRDDARNGRAAARLGAPGRLAARQRAAAAATSTCWPAAHPDDLERLAGMAFLNGIPVRLEPVAPAAGGGRGWPPRPRPA